MPRTNDFLTTLIAACALTLGSCEYDAEEDPVDVQLLELARETAGYTWYKESATLLPRSPGSGHAQAFLRTRFNAPASTMLDTNGQVITGADFPDGSVIVKELFDDPTALAQYAVLYKKSDHPYADADGWVWGYVRTDGEVREPASNKGSACRGCHGQDGNIDHTLMNIYFP